MIRSGFKRAIQQATPDWASALFRAVKCSGKQSRCDADLTARPKEHVIQHAAYMRLVRAMPCANCGVVGYTQFCHADEGKGMAIKTDCRLGWPGCSPHGVGNPGCHYVIGTSGILPRSVKRELEWRYGQQTRRAILAAGTWPNTLPKWED